MDALDPVRKKLYIDGLIRRATEGDPEAQAELDRIQGGLGQASAVQRPPRTPERMPSREEYGKQFTTLDWLRSKYPDAPSIDSLYDQEQRDIQRLNQTMAQDEITRYASGGYASGGGHSQCPFCGK